MSNLTKFGAVILAVLIVGCLHTTFPEFKSVDGPTGDVGYLDIITSTAEVDPKNWENTEIYLRFATSVDALKSIEATQKVCPKPYDSIHRCTQKFPNAWDKRKLVFQTGTTVYYQWFIDYWIPDGNDIATIEGEVRSFTIVTPKSCVQGSNRPHEKCPDGQSCDRDFIRADLETGLGPTACFKK